MNDAASLLSDLSHFTGSETLMPYSFGLCLTEGVRCLADRAGCYWLLDIIGSTQGLPSVRAESFQSWKIDVADDDSCVVLCDDGNGNVIYTQAVEYTDFPIRKFGLFAVRDGAGVVLMLKSEY
jgi:hypothetical protein